MNDIGVIGGADGTTQIVVSGSIGGPILWIFFGALALMVILYAAFYRRGKGKAVCLALAAVFCVAADQAVKFLVVNTMSPGESEPLLPPLLQLTRVHNYGAAWSSFSGARWLLIALTAAGMCAIAWLLVKIVRHPLGQWSLAIILGGGIGNLIDRVRLGYVVDMLDTMFMDFPVFNVADVFVVCGTVCALIYYLAFYSKSDEKNWGTRSMEPILLQTSEADAGTRLDACLARAIEDLTRSAAAKAVEDGRVLVNGKARTRATSSRDTSRSNSPRRARAHRRRSAGHPSGRCLRGRRRHRRQQAERTRRPSRAGPSGRDARERPFVSLRRQSLRRRRRAAPRHRAPHRPRHERAHHRGKKRLRAPVPLRPAGRPHARAHV